LTASAEFYVASELSEKKYPRIQILTIEELLRGDKIEHPAAVEAVNVTFKKTRPPVVIGVSKKKTGLLQQTTLHKHQRSH
jgi:hypothetical protein